MPSVKERLGALRRRRPYVDHVLRMQEHYSAVKGSLQAGAVTYFAFLSFFPILALAFAVVGYVAHVFPAAQRTLVDAIREVLPGLVSMRETPGKIAITTLQEAAPAIFSIGLLVVLYSGLGWLSAMRDALLVVFEKPQKEQPNFVIGKIKDLAAMVLLGLVLMVSVAVSGVVTALAEPILSFLTIGLGAEPLLVVVAVALGLAANSLLFFAFFTLLGDPDEPAKSLWQGALLGAIGFEVLKLASTYLIKSTSDQPAFQAFGISLILIVWINYFSRVVMYAAAWAHTTPAARAVRDRQALEADRRELEAMELARVDLHEAPSARRPGRAAAFAAGGVSMLGLMALLRRRRGDR